LRENGRIDRVYIYQDGITNMISHTLCSMRMYLTSIFGLKVKKIK